MYDKQNLIYIWGVKFNLLDLKEFINQIDNKVQSGQTPVHITGVNTDTIVHASRDTLVHESIMKSDFVNVDNAFTVLALRALGYRVPGRVATPDLFESLLQLANQRNYKVFVLGAKQNVLNKAIVKIQKEYPGIHIHSNHGYYDRQKEYQVINKINTFTPDFLFIALPSPEKESFILKYKDILHAKLLLGIGGAIDAKAGTVKRAPLVLRKIGLEGFYRIIQNPQYFGKRFLTYHPAFIKLFFKTLFNRI